MAGGKRWTRDEIQLLREMIQKGTSAQEILESGRLPGRTYRSIDTEVKRLSFAPQKIFNAPQISEAEIVGLETIVKRYVDAFNKICDLTEYDKTDLERFRIIFMAAWKYRDLFAEYERLRQVEEKMEEIRKRLEVLEAQARATAKAG